MLNSVKSLQRIKVLNRISNLNRILSTSTLSAPSVRLMSSEARPNLAAGVSGSNGNGSDSNTVTQVITPQAPQVVHKKNMTSRQFILNNPKALNALNLDMVRNITPQLQAWEISDISKVIMIKSNLPKAFCAGGDVKTVTQLGKAKDPTALQFFYEEYQLNHLIATLKTPFVALLNGITMGGGVGLSVHAPFRIATEKTLFGMPETKIGLFPDVGGSFFLPRLDGYLGTYLALTSESIKGLDTLFAGIATHYVPSDRLPALEERLAELDSSDPDVVNLAIEDYVAEIPEDYEFSLQKYKNVIDQCFRHDDVRLIFKELEKVIESNTEHSAWAQRTLDGLKQRSPTSLVVSLEQIRRGKTMKIDQIFRMELRIVSEFLKDHDFYEGVDSVLVRKTNDPKWKPSTIQEVPVIDVIQNYFDHPRPEVPQLELLNKDPLRQYSEYPHAKYSLPSETEIHKLVTGSDGASFVPTVDDIYQTLLVGRNNKVGAREKIKMILDAKTTVDDTTGEVKWN